MMANDDSLQRVFKGFPKKVYRAFTEAYTMATRIPPYEFICMVQEFKCRVGGNTKMTFYSFSTGSS